MTLADGTVHSIKVTDDPANEADFSIIKYEGDHYAYVDGHSAGGNSYVQLFLDGDGLPQSNDNIPLFNTQPLLIDGRGVNGCMEIVLQKESGAGTSLYWDLVGLKIIGGAHVVIRLGDTFSGNEMTIPMLVLVPVPCLIFRMEVCTSTLIPTIAVF